MKKEPIGLYILRLLTAFFLLFFMLMLYWSSVVQEESLKAINQKLIQLNSEIKQLKSNHTFSLNPPVPQQNSLSTREHIDSNLPNLLSVDPFYQTTLPKLLGDSFVPHGTFQNATIGKPQNLEPFSGWANITEWVSQCNVSVAKQAFGIFETLTPDMAIKMEERKRKNQEGTEYWIHLRDNVFWQPLRNDFFPEDIHLSPHFLQPHKVTAEDYKFAFDVMMNPSVEAAGAISMRNYLGDIEEIEIIDPLTFIVRWKQEPVEIDGKTTLKAKYISKLWTGSLSPLASFVYKYLPDGTKIIENDEDSNTYRTNSAFGQNFNQHFARNIIVSCGGWVFDGMTDRQIAFHRNNDFYDPLAVLGEKQVVAFKSAAENIWQDFKEGSLDSYGLQPDQLIELERFLGSDEHHKQQKAGKGINRLDYVARVYQYIAWNQNTPYFNNKMVRRAMTLAIDRRRIIDQYLNKMGIEITGPFFRFSPSYNEQIKPWPFDLDEAKKILANEGWYDSDADGIIDKEIDGKRVAFRFNLTYYVKNDTMKSICEYVATSLKEIGIDCNLNGVDQADLSAVFEDKQFDALALGWALATPPEDVKQLWSSAGAKEKGSSNAVGFSNKEADEIIEKLQFEYNQEERLRLYHRFHEIIHLEQPYTFLFSPKSIFLYRNYLKNVFIPKERQDLVPGANVGEPISSIFFITNGT